MPTFADEIRDLARLGATVRPEFLREDGSVEEARAVDIPIIELLISERAIAWCGDGAERTHAFRLKEIRQDGDEYILATDNPRLRLVIGPAAFEHERSAIERGRPAPAAAMEDMRELFDAISR